MKFNSLIPELSVSDLSRSLEFYKDIVGFQVEYDRPADKFSFISYENIQLMLEQVNGNWETGTLVYPFGRGINFQIEVRNIQSLVKKVQEMSVEFFKEPEDVWYEVGDLRIAQRQFLIIDPDGYLLRFCQRI